MQSPFCGPPSSILPPPLPFPIDGGEVSLPDLFPEVDWSMLDLPAQDPEAHNNDFDWDKFMEDVPLPRIPFYDPEPFTLCVSAFPGAFWGKQHGVLHKFYLFCRLNDKNREMLEGQSESSFESYWDDEEWAAFVRRVRKNVDCDPHSLPLSKSVSSGFVYNEAVEWMTTNQRRIEDVMIHLCRIINEQSLKLRVLGVAKDHPSYDEDDVKQRWEYGTLIRLEITRQAPEANELGMAMIYVPPIGLPEMFTLVRNGDSSTPLRALFAADRT